MRGYKIFGAYALTLICITIIACVNVHANASNNATRIDTYTLQRAINVLNRHANATLQVVGDVQCVLYYNDDMRTNQRLPVAHFASFKQYDDCVRYIARVYHYDRIALRH